MATWLQRILALSILCSMPLWWLWSESAGLEPGLRWAVLPVLLLPHGPLLALEYWLLARYGRNDVTVVPRAWRLARACLGETWTAWRVFGWWQPFRANDIPDFQGQKGHRGVVLVHGYFCNRGLWTPWLRMLRARGIPCMAVTLSPSFGGIDDMTRILGTAIESLRDRTGMPPMVVAHSMGGLVLRSWLARTPGADQLVDSLVTIGTPHQGTWMARFAHGANGRQMRPGGLWLAELSRLENAERRARFVCFYSDADAIVFPSDLAHLPGADNRLVSGVGHVALAYRPEVMNWAIAHLQRTDD